MQKQTAPNAGVVTLPMARSFGALLKMTNFTCVENVDLQLGEIQDRAL